MKNDITKFQDSYNSYMESQVSKTFGSVVGPDFKAFQHSGGFNYMTYDGFKYNYLTIECLDSLLKNNTETEQLDLEEGGFSRLYYDVLRSTSYTLSQESQNKANQAMTKYSAQASAVITRYKASDLPALKSTSPDAAIAEIYKNCAAEFGGDVTIDCSIIPNSYSQLKAALQQLNNMARDSMQAVINQGNKNAVLDHIIDNMTTPSIENGGIPVDSESISYYVGYEKIPAPNDLIGSLNTERNSITISVSGESSDMNSMNVHVDNGSYFNIPILALIDVEVDHKSTFDMNKLKTNETSFDAEITYSGLTVVPVQPAQSSIDGKSGWFSDTTILKEIRNNTKNDNADGYKLIDNRYNVDTLFGGSLARLKTLLISKTPSITITLSKIDMNYARSVFSMENDVTVTLFGFIKIGHHKNSYNTSNITYNDEEQSVQLTFSEPDTSGTPDVKGLTAFIMGGVPDYPGIN